MKKKFLILSIVIGILGISSVVAQNTKPASHNINISIPEVALLDLESASSTTISMSAIAPNEAGNAIDFSKAKNSAIWINYSSIIGNSSKPNRKVSAVVNGKIPRGTSLKVYASPYSGNGAGTTGTPVGIVELSETEQDLITDIGSCYTGDGINNGHRLYYNLELDHKDKDAYAQLDFDQTASITVTYTLSD